MSEQPKCVQCGGKEFVLESGFYFCAECQMQSQDTQQHLYEEFYGGQKFTRMSLGNQQSQELNSQDPVESTRKELTSWEVLNYILKGLVNELILLGASTELKPVTLQLWASFLQKIEVAFISKKIETRPKLGVVFRRRDAELIYGVTDEESRAHKYPAYRKPNPKRSRSKVSNTSVSSLPSSLRGERYRLSVNKKVLAKAEYKETGSEANQSHGGLRLDSLSDTQSQDSSRKSHKLHYSKSAKQSLSGFLELLKKAPQDDKRSIQKKLLTRESLSFRNPTVMQILAILRLSLFLIGEDIYLADLFRWAEEGYLSITNAEKHLPPDASIEKDIKFMFTSTLSSWRHITKQVYNMSHLLRANFKFDLSSLLQKYVTELNLPDEIYIIIRKLMKLKKPRLLFRSSTNHEGRVVAFILLVLKLLFGLDDVTEKKLSSFANTINTDSVAVAIKGEQFSWQKWTEHIIYRGALIASVHQPTRAKLYRNSSVGGSLPFLSQWDNSQIQQIFKRHHVVDNNLKDSISRLTNNLVEPLTEPMIKPSNTPMFSAYETLCKGKTKENFKQKSLAYLLDEEYQAEMARKFNVAFSTNLNGSFIKVAPRKLTKKPKLSMSKKATRVKLVIETSDSSDSSEEDRPSRREIRIADQDRVVSNVEKFIYQPGGEYWIYHGAFSIGYFAEGEFNALAAEAFSASFYWLLSECSRMVNQCTRDVYTELVKLEKVYFKYWSKDSSSAPKYLRDMW